MAKNDPPPARKRKALPASEPEVELEPVVYEAEFVEPETALVPVINISSMQAKINKLVGVQTYEVPTKCWLDTGFPDLNRALGSPEYGIPFGKMIELAGVEHSGKTLLATYLAGLAQQDGAAVGYIDLENSADDLWAGKLGLDMSQVMLISPKLVKPVNKPKEPWTLEGAEDMFYQAELSMSMFAQAGFKFQAWIVDSIANMQTRMSVEAGATKANMRTRMDRSLFLSENLPRWAGLCANYNAMVIFVNQLRNKVGLVFGDPEYCLASDSYVYFEDGRKLSISEVVDNRIQGNILTKDIDGNLVYSAITDWHNNGKTESIKDWLRVKTNGPGTSCGYVSLRVTKKHKLFLMSGKEIRAEQLKPGMQLQTWEERWFEKPSLAKDILLGSLLGDCGLFSSANGNHTAALHLANGLQNDYLQWKLKHLSFLDFKCYRDYLYRSAYTTELSMYRSMFYSSGGRHGRTFPESLQLTDRMVAVWFMDDGAYHHGGTGLISRARGMKSSVERDRVRKALMSWLGSDKVSVSSRKIMIGANTDFFKRIAPFIHPSMQYKLPEIYRGLYTYKGEYKNSIIPELCSYPLVVTDVTTPIKTKVCLTKYDLSVEGTGRYFAGTSELGMLVHNSPGGRAVAHNCSIRARLRRIKNGKILGPDGTVIGLSATVANYKNKAGQGSNQEGKTAFRAKWNNAQIAMSVMTVKDAKEEDDE